MLDSSSAGAQISTEVERVKQAWLQRVEEEFTRESSDPCHKVISWKKLAAYHHIDEPSTRMGWNAVVEKGALARNELPITKRVRRLHAIHHMTAMPPPPAHQVPPPSQQSPLQPPQPSMPPPLPHAVPPLLERRLHVIQHMTAMPQHTHQR